jgi:hypothetical protein
VIRRSLTPPVGIPLDGLLPTRRAGGARHNVSYRLTFRRGEGDAAVEIPGWALNISRGGLRAIVEDRVELGEVLDVTIHDEGLERRGQIVWTQEEPDGMIVGISFRERIEVAPPGMELDGSAEIAPGELAHKLELNEEELEALADLAPKPPGQGGPGRGGPGTGGGA